jgi:hypothetical protein
MPPNYRALATHTLSKALLMTESGHQEGLEMRTLAEKLQKMVPGLDTERAGDNDADYERLVKVSMRI